MTDNLKQKTAKSMLWGLMNNGSTQVLNLIIGVFLARLLTPAEYGIVGVLAIFTTLAGDLQSAGFTQALINLREPKSRDYNSVFWFNVLMSVFLYVVLFFAAPLIADYFHQDCLIIVSRVTFLSFVISSLGIAHNAFLAKNLMIREQTIAGFVALIGSGVIGISMAFCGMSYWSLVGQQLSYITLLNLVRLYYSYWRPSLNIDFGPVRSMFGFAVNMLFTKIITTLSNNLLTFIFGRMYAISAVGNYTQANKWNTMAYSFLNGTVQQIAQPILASVGDDIEREHRVFRKMLRFMSMVTFPVMFTLAIVSREVILITIGEQWLVCADMLKILCVGGAFMPLISLYQNLSISRGRSDIYLYLNIVQVIGQLLIVWFLAEYGIEVMILAVSIYNILMLYIWQIVAGRLAKVGFMSMLSDVMSFAWYAFIMATITMFIPDISNVFLSLLVRSGSCVVIYVVLMWFDDSDVFNESLDFIRHRNIK